jgi:hypothetical protein
LLNLIFLFPEDPVEYFCGIFIGGPSLTKALLRDRKREKAQVVTGDPEFEKLKGMVEIDWLENKVMGA